MRKTIQQNIARTLLLLSLIIFAFWFALKDDYQSVMIQISGISITWLIIIGSLGILYYLIQGFILYLIARKYNENIKFRDGIKNAYIAAFFNGVTPMGGGQVAQTYAFRKLNLKYRDIASILWTDFFMYQCIIILYAISIIILRLPYILETFPHYFILVIIGLFVNSFVIIALWTFLKFPNFYLKASNIIVHFLHKIKVIKDVESTQKNWRIQIGHFLNEISKLQKDKKLVIQSVCLNIIRITIFYAIPYFVALGLGIKLNIMDLMNIILMSCFIHMLNALTPLPGDTGWTESAFILIFCSLFTRVEASSIMILWRFATYYLNLLIGGVTFLMIKTKKSTD
ncbi:MAG: lysylphosphatidylglycerol synthase transmembrane domain-containing protein [Erysipelotrichaceae bacterium]